MADTVFKIGDIAFFDDRRHRIIYISSEDIYMCEMDTTRTVISSLPLTMMQENISTGACEIIHDDTHQVVDIESLSESAAKDFKERKAVIDAVRREYGPDYMGLNGKTSKPVIEEILQKNSRTPKWFWMTVRRYLQGGLSESSLVNSKRKPKVYLYKTKTGRKGIYGVSTNFIVDSACEEAFNYGLEWYKSGRAKSFPKAFDMMNSKYFSLKDIKDGRYISRLLPITERPSFRQFYTWCHNHLKPEEKDRIKTSRREQRNDRRLLPGEAASGTIAPGEKVEIDALEVDLSLISLVNWGQTVGRPIVYAMRDVATHAIVAVSVSFENNSVLGLTNLLMNLVDDKDELCKRIGLKVENIDKIWPSRFIPSNIYTDRGSDFKSNKAKEIFNALGIERHLVPPATGSLKGMIEQWFHQIHSDINSHTEKHGLIEKRYDSMHHEQASLTITEFTRMLYIALVAYNQKHMDDYRRTAEMVMDDVDATPAILWEYLCRKKGAPRPIENRMDYIYKLLVPAQAKVTRRGIEMPKTHLRYINPDDPNLLGIMYSAADKGKRFNVKYDPRDNSQIYYVNKKGHLMVAGLCHIEWMQSLKGLSVKETLDYMTNEKISNAKALERNDQINADKADAYESIVKHATKERKDIRPVTSGMNKEREKERGLINSMNKVCARLGLPSGPDDEPEAERFDVLSPNVEADYYAALEELE